MRNRANRITTAIAAMSALLASLCLGFAGQSVELKPLNLEQTQGAVRVVLLRAGLVVSTNNETQFVVTYVVEVPRQGAFSDLSFSSNDEISLIVKGKPIEFHGESSSSTMGFKDLPRQSELIKPSVTEGKEMIAQDIIFKELKIAAREFDVTFQFAWRKTPMLFNFKDVPLN